MNYVLTVICVVGTLTLLDIRFSHWLANRSPAAALKEWQKTSGYTIVAKQNRLMLRGPFYFRSTNKQVVYRLWLEDKKGRRRMGWVRCGHWMLGTFFDCKPMKVILDEIVYEPSPLDE